MKKLLAIASLAFLPLNAGEPVTIRVPESYFQSIQYNWTGEYDSEGKKIPGENPECILRGIYHPQDAESSHNDPFSIVDFKVLAGAQFNPVRFKTISNIVYITSGTGQLKLYDDTGVVTEYAVEPHFTIRIPAMTRYSFVSTNESDLNGIIFSSPAWFVEDEEYDWDLVKMVITNETK